jgi:hypothetical protein
MEDVGRKQKERGRFSTSLENSDSLDPNLLLCKGPSTRTFSHLILCPISHPISCKSDGDSSSVGGRSGKV